MYNTMANYKAPGIAVYQTIQRNAGVGLPDQNVSLVGPSASLRLYNTTAAERERSRAGEYIAVERSVFLWPREIGDDFVDFDYTKVYLRNALLKYGTATATILEKQYNQITVAEGATNFQGDRGFRVGDVVSIEVGGKTIISAIHGIESVASLTPIVDADAVPADGNRASGAGYTIPEIVINGTYTGTRDTT